ncbi:MAG: cation-translocating P-type ATPase [Microvirga sp.]
MTQPSHAGARPHPKAGHAHPASHRDAVPAPRAPGHGPASGTFGPRDHHHHHDHDHDHGHHHGHDHVDHDHDDPDHDHDHHDHDHGFDRLEAARIAVTFLCAIGAWFTEAFFFSAGSLGERVHDFAAQFDPWQVLALGDLLPQAVKGALPPAVFQWIDYYLAIPFSLYAAIGLLFGGWPIFREAVHDLRERRMTMELSMTIAILAAAYTGYFFVALMVTFFVLVAEVLEGLTIERGRRAIRSLLEILPREVNVRRHGHVVTIGTDTLAIGETVLLSPGGRVPVDGAVVGGHSFVDESKITGESMPVEKVAGERVFAGSINQSGALEIRAERIGADTSYGRIIEAVERAERSRAPVTRMADRLAGYIVLFAMGFAALTHYLYRDVSATISVLVVAGACGIAAGTPLAILGGIGRAARLGAIVKGGIHLETLGRVDTVVLDKTGTLTFGVPGITSVVGAHGVADAEVLAVAASAELRSEHPLGKAIVAEAQARGHEVREPDGFDYTPGRGIAASVGGSRVLVGNAAWMRDNSIGMADLEADAGATTAFVARAGRFIGAISVADRVRPEARQALDRMRGMGIHTILLTGDSAGVARAVAGELGLVDAEADLLPEDKVQRIRALVARGRVVAMVGDGVNDAPALAAAGVGVAMGSGTDVARESADVVLIGNDLARFVDTLAVARRARRIIWQNFAGTIVIDIAGIALAMIGWIGPVAAVQIHTGSELLFILNSARLLPRLVPFRIGRGRQDATVAPPPVSRPVVTPGG